MRKNDAYKGTYIANLFSLFVDAHKDLRYEFSNGVVITTNSDGEYRHTLEVQMPLGVFVTHVYRIDACCGDKRDYYERYVEITDFRRFKANTVGWLKKLPNLKPNELYQRDPVYAEK